MSDKLKTFIDERRQEFDTAEPRKDIWKKMDEQIKVGASPSIGSNWMSKFIYLGFSLSALIIATYFITGKFNDSPVNKPNDGFSLSGKKLHAVKSSEDIAVNTESNIDVVKNKSEKEKSSFTNDVAHNIKSTQTEELNDKLHLVFNSDSVAMAPYDQTAHSESYLSANKNTKKEELYIPKAPSEVNSYICIVYESSFFKPMLQAFKFPGKVSLDRLSHIRSRDRDYRRRLKTMSCATLENTTNMKAVWIKGNTDKEIELSVAKKFKNIWLIKSDGSQFNPEAISHYYPGLGVISGYTGDYFNMIFKDKVELILFFKNINVGDKIVVDGIIKAVVINKP